jgi:hypothetical protein
VNFVVDGLGVGVYDDGNLRLLVLGLEAQGRGVAVLVGLWHRYWHGLECRTVGHVVLSLILVFEPMQAPGAVVAFVFVARVEEAIEAGDDNVMLLEEEEVDALLVGVLSAH